MTQTLRDATSTPEIAVNTGATPFQKDSGWGPNTHAKPRVKYPPTCICVVRKLSDMSNHAKQRYTSTYADSRINPPVQNQAGRIDNGLGAAEL